MTTTDQQPQHAEIERRIAELDLEIEIAAHRVKEAEAALEREARALAKLVVA